MSESGGSARERREAVAASWRLERGAVLVAAGVPVPIAGTDQYHEFHAHAEHRYLAGTGVPGAVLAFDPGEGWVLFAPVAGAEERVWTGDSEPPDLLAAAGRLDSVRPAGELRSWLERRRGEPLAVLGNHDLVDLPGRYGLELWDRLEVFPDARLSEELSEQIAVARRTKDGDELRLMQRAADASAEGHRLAMRLARPGLTERALQVELEAQFFRAGAARTAYGSIVGTGANGAVLHFSPTSRKLADGDLVLIDAGAEVDGYASDVTRTFPAGPSFEGIRRDLYELVLAVQKRAIADARPGKEYRDLHLEAAARLADGLVQLGILRGEAADLVDRDAHALFFPHGLGHMLGLATHDAGGCLSGRLASDRFGLKWLRADLPLQAGYVVTIEPGLYFIRALLDDPGVRERYRDDVNWDRVDTLRDFGGIRIEDDVVITEGEAMVLSAGVPKEIPQIEALRAEAFA